MARSRARRSRKRRGGMKRRRRGHKRRRGRQGPTTMRVRSLMMPQQTFVKLRVRWSAVIADVNGAQTFFHISGNSLNDPLVVEGTRKPLGFSQWKSFYDRYQVLASKCECTVTHNAQPLGPLFVYFRPDDTQSVLGIDDAAEQPGTSSRLMPPDTSRTLHFKGFRTTKAMFGLPGLITAHVESTSASGSNPENPWFWMISVASPGPSGYNLFVSGVTTFYCRLYDLRNVTASP